MGISRKEDNHTSLLPLLQGMRWINPDFLGTLNVASLRAQRRGVEGNLKIWICPASPKKRVRNNRVDNAALLLTFYHPV
jgi:hypothetical protein